MIDKNQTIAISLFLVFGILALYLMEVSGLSDEFLNTALSKTVEGSMAQKLTLNVGYLIAGIILIPISFAVVSVYSLIHQKIDFILIASGIILLLSSLFFIGMSKTGAAFGIGLLISTYLIQYLSIDDAKAYKELRPSRIARGAVSNSILLISTLVAFSVFLTVSQDGRYAENGINTLVDSIVKVTVDKETLTTLEDMPDGIETLYDKIKSSEIIKILEKYYSHMSAVTAFAIIQVLGIIIAPLAGLYAWIIWKMSDIER